MQDDSLTFIPCYRSYIGSFLVLTFLLACQKAVRFVEALSSFCAHQIKHHLSTWKTKTFDVLGSVLKEQVIPIPIPLRLRRNYKILHVADDCTISHPGVPCQLAVLPDRRRQQEDYYRVPSVPAHVIISSRPTSARSFRYSSTVSLLSINSIISRSTCLGIVFTLLSFVCDNGLYIITCQALSSL